MSPAAVRFETLTCFEILAFENQLSLLACSNCRRCCRSDVPPCRKPELLGLTTALVTKETPHCKDFETAARAMQAPEVFIGLCKGLQYLARYRHHRSSCDQSGSSSQSFPELYKRDTGVWVLKLHRIFTASIFPFFPTSPTLKFVQHISFQHYHRFTLQLTQRKR